MFTSGLLSRDRAAGQTACTQNDYRLKAVERSTTECKQKLFLDKRLERAELLKAELNLRAQSHDGSCFMARKRSRDALLQDWLNRLTSFKCFGTLLEGPRLISETVFLRLKQSNRTNHIAY